MVRFAETLDLPAICEIRRQVHKIHTDGRPDIYRMPEQNEVFDLLLRNAFLREDYRLFVCEENSAITGYALVRLVTSGKSTISHDRYYHFIEEFGVAEAERGRGFGTELMYAIIDDAKLHHAASLELDVWSFNEDAENFYRNFGMKTKRTVLELDLT